MMHLPGDELKEIRGRIYETILAKMLFDLLLIFSYFSIY